MRKLGADERHMTDITQSPSWFVHERVVHEQGPGRTVALPGGPYTKFYSGWYGAADFTEEHRDRHAEVVLAHAADLGLARYVQHRSLRDSAITHLSRTVRGTVPDAFDGLDEYAWYRDDLVRALATPAGQAAPALAMG